MVARKKDRISEEFDSIESTGRFWDNHSLADYKNETKPVEMNIQISKRTRYIAIPEEIYIKLALRAGRKNRTVREMVFDLAR